MYWLELLVDKPPHRDKVSSIEGERCLLNSDGLHEAYDFCTPANSTVLDKKKTSWYLSYHAKFGHEHNFQQSIFLFNIRKKAEERIGKHQNF